MSAKKQRVGLAGEKAARRYLEGIGFHITDLNYRCLLGAIDIVAREAVKIACREIRAL